MQALGIVTEQDIGYVRSTIQQLAGVRLKQDIHTAIEQLVEAGERVTVQLDAVTPIYYPVAGRLQQILPHHGLSHATTIPHSTLTRVPYVVDPYSDWTKRKSCLKVLSAFDAGTRDVTPGNLQAQEK